MNSSPLPRLSPEQAASKLRKLAAHMREYGNFHFIPMDAEGVTGVDHSLDDELRAIAYQLDGNID